MKVVMVKVILAMLTLLGLVNSAMAGGPDNDEPCSHPNFVTHECLDSLALDGADGIDGVDGVDGADGMSGLRGPVGPTGATGAIGPEGPAGQPGPRGPAGPRGVDGTVSSQWYNDIRGHFAATAAAQVHLPQDKNSRLTIGTARVMGRTGIGVGYAYRASDEGRTAFTLALGRSNGAKVVQLGISVEF
jgi:hypothetical protein